MKNNLFLLVLLVLVLFYSGFSSAALIGVSPARIDFKNVLRGGYSERVVTITINSEEDAFVEISPRGEVSDWINLSESEFKVSKDEPYSLVVSVSPPGDVPNGNYSGYLRLRSSGASVGAMEGRAVSAVIPVIDLSLNVEITDVEFVECRASNFQVSSVEEGDYITFRADILNTGNVRLRPRIRIDIWDQFQLEMLESEVFDEVEINPTTKQTVEIMMSSNNLDVGQYWSDVVAVDCYDSDVLTFDVLREGSLRAFGRLINILSNPWIDVGDTTLIEVLFENEGEKDVNAFFKGRINLGDRIVQLIETERVNVAMGERNNFDVYFSPQNPGRYVVSGRVHYDNKITYEKSTIINVRPSGFNLFSYSKYLIYIILVAGISYLSYRIRKEKKSYKNKLRRLGR